MEMNTFDEHQVLTHYRDLNRAEDELFLQGRIEEAKSIHVRAHELEEEARTNGYLLSVLPDSAWRPGEEICFIRKILPKE